MPCETAEHALTPSVQDSREKEYCRVRRLFGFLFTLWRQVHNRGTPASPGMPAWHTGARHVEQRRYGKAYPLFGTAPSLPLLKSETNSGREFADNSQPHRLRRTP